MILIAEVLFVDVHEGKKVIVTFHSRITSTTYY